MVVGARNPLASLVGYQLRRASACAMEELSRELLAIGLRPTEASAILLIGVNPMIKPSEVGRELGIQRANMTPLVAALERMGLIRREAVDGRSQGLLLTTSGQAACDSAFNVMRRHDEILLARLKKSEASELPSLLAKLWSMSLAES